MSVSGFSDQDRVYRKSTQRRNDSGELDVFEATRYFYGCNETSGCNGAISSQKATGEEKQSLSTGRRMSLDMPTRSSLPSKSHRVEKQMMNEKIYKQPSSPGGRLASFLNSLFLQAASKKKKSKSSTQSLKDEESPSGRRKRRSSVSLFRSANTNDSKSVYASSTASGFRTPPSYVITPTKGYKDLRSYSDQRHVVSLPRYTEKVKSPSSQENNFDEKKNMDITWLDEKFKFIDELGKKDKNVFNKDRICVDNFLSSQKKNVKSLEVDDGGESDASSDLFELENYDLGVYSSDLPVYETTHMENIKRGAPISN
ncbi:hypothetical protein IFM89_038503 [Coptis chinensis]|uniref:Protein BIG GRAIN 1-like E n=1 Tax=Coptis chinensis TaxID=261450 RepID=A0A835J093_9MAGN|nr:hypothetical protein IFM89_038503 [Coptis chinensis]